MSGRRGSKQAKEKESPPEQIQKCSSAILDKFSTTTATWKSRRQLELECECLREICTTCDLKAVEGVLSESTKADMRQLAGVLEKLREKIDRAFEQAAQKPCCPCTSFESRLRKALSDCPACEPEVLRFLRSLAACVIFALLDAFQQIERMTGEISKRVVAVEKSHINLDEAAMLCIEAHKLRYGHGVPVNCLTAYDLYVCAAEIGSPEGMCCAGILLEEGKVDALRLGSDRRKDRERALRKVRAKIRSAEGSEEGEGAEGDGNDEEEEEEPPTLDSLLGVGADPRHCLYTKLEGKMRDALDPITKSKRLYEAQKWYEAAAALDHSDAIYRLARMTEKGEGELRMDKKKAAALYYKAAELGHAEAQADVGHLYEIGCGEDFRQSYKGAYSWYLKSASQKSSRGINNLASLLFEGRGCSRDVERAAELFKIAADMGNTAAQFNLGICYEFGLGVSTPDSDAACRLYEAAANKGHVRAGASLGYLLYRMAAQAGSPQEHFVEAAKWLRKASEDGDGEAAYYLGQMHEGGNGVGRDLLQAYGQYVKAAERGWLKAHARIGALLLQGGGGLGTPNPKKAVQHFRVAAQQNDPEGLNSLGLCFQEGLALEDGRADFQQAAECFERAVEGGDVGAMHNLANLYEKGLGVVQSSSRAHRLLEEAAARGNVQARTSLNRSLHRRGLLTLPPASQMEKTHTGQLSPARPSVSPQLAATTSQAFKYPPGGSPVSADGYVSGAGGLGQTAYGGLAGSPNGVLPGGRRRMMSTGATGVLSSLDLAFQTPTPVNSRVARSGSFPGAQLQTAQQQPAVDAEAAPPALPPLLASSQAGEHMMPMPTQSPLRSNLPSGIGGASGLWGSSPPLGLSSPLYAQAYQRMEEQARQSQDQSPDMDDILKGRVLRPAFRDRVNHQVIQKHPVKGETVSSPSFSNRGARGSRRSSPTKNTGGREANRFHRAQPDPDLASGMPTFAPSPEPAQPIQPILLPEQGLHPRHEGGDSREEGMHQ
uniref:Uncharacterized protein n=1 Tax=Chromera velia CCMP2878 TaxID=1169474 RepID=A0A0G4F4T3_9ALVE|eukprot:Cvel_15039.t1-p1 / transcript=Cvel_15039.t1 / gene=Cvel_15039 / organism=Chromera_velia_CCMP2878 / gene_product=Uncharacterized protein YbeQ, putative / transcript_product=Uncharacterized protein YbeQ, putative / location=Cvel_scaffold1095:12202-22010(-) / protein_length=997 / sequence_SO=supercontig / SO=protein_coding / is_pseudo=false